MLAASATGRDCAADPFYREVIGEIALGRGGDGTGQKTPCYGGGRVGHRAACAGAAGVAVECRHSVKTFAKRHFEEFVVGLMRDVVCGSFYDAAATARVGVPC